MNEVLEKTKEIIFPDEPDIRWTVKEFNTLLNWCVEKNASDIMLNSDECGWIKINNDWIRCTERKLNTTDINSIIDTITGSAASSARILSGEPLDFDYELRINRSKKLLFRANATGTRCSSSAGSSLILRVNPQHPPTLKSLDVQPEITEAAFPHDGLVLITGVMGSGKTTLIASFLREILTTSKRFVGTFESPIEFNLTTLGNRKGPITQASIPLNISKFKEAPRNITRRAMDVVLVGELRDRETMKGVIEMSEIGVAAYATVHTRSAEETPQRILNAFDNLERNQMASALFSSLRLIVHQRLVPKTGGGRIALREWLVFNDATRVKLMHSASHNDVFKTLRKEVNDGCSSLLHDAKKKYDENLISKEIYQEIKNEREIVNNYEDEI